MKPTSHRFGLRALMTLVVAPERRFTIEQLAQRRRLCRFTQAIRRSLEPFLAELDKVTLAELGAPRHSLRAHARLDPTSQIAGQRHLGKSLGR